MPDALDTASTEPDMTLVRTVHVRRDDDPGTLADDIVSLLEPEGAVLDLSRYDRRADIVQVRVADQYRRSEV